MGHAHGPTDPRRLGWVLALTGGFMAVEFAGALWTGSLALLADAGHMLRDSLGLVVAFAAARLARRPPDARFSFGYRRFEVLGAAVNGLFLLSLTGFIAVDALHRLSNPEPVEGGWMLAFGALGLAVNAAGLLLLRGAYLEVWADALGSLGVIAAGAVVLGTGWAAADGLVGLGIAAWMVPRTLALLREAGAILLQGAPPSVDLAALEADLRALPGVRGLHDLHLWALSDERLVLSVHLETGPLEAAAQTHLLQAAQDAAARHGVGHATVQLEPEPLRETLSH